MPLECSILTLSQVVDMYLIFKNIDKRKNYKQALVIAQEVWKEIFQNTLFITKSFYVPLIKGTPYNYIEIPPNSVRFLSLAITDHCHQLKPLYYNQNLNVLVRPKDKACGCDACDCGGMCETVNSVVPVTKEVIIEGESYTDTTWIKVCPNGDVMEYRTIPTLQYTFNRGSYDSSYDISYEIGSSNSEVVTYELSRKLCSLEIAPCGCPTQTEENETLFYNNCGCYLNPLTPIRIKCEKHWGCRNYFAGQIKMSDCGTKIFVEHLDDFSDNQQLVMTYQTNGIEPDGQTNVPDYAKMAIFTGIDYYKNLFNDRIPAVLKQNGYYKFIDEQNKVIIYNNKVAIEWLQAQPTVANW